MYSLLEGEGKNTTPFLKSPLSANWRSGGFVPNTGTSTAASQRVIIF